MASVAVAARQRARAARLRMQADRDVRDARIEEQVTAVLLAAGGIDQADATLEEAQKAHELAVRAAEKEIAAGTAALAGEGLTVAEIAGLLDLADKRVRQLIRDGRGPVAVTKSGTPAAVRAGGDPGGTAASLSQAGEGEPGEDRAPVAGNAEAVGV